MKRALIFIFSLMMMLAVRPVTSAQIDIPDDIPFEELVGTPNHSGTVSLAGPGLSQLDFDGNPDENGLMWTINEPKRKFENWTVAVKNESGEEVTNLVVTLQIKVDGQWYLGDIQGSNALVRPTIIPDGGVGMVQVGSVGGSPQNWTDFRIVVESINEPLDFTIVPLDFDLVENRGIYSIDVTGHEHFSVRNVWVYAGCVVDGTVSEIKVTTSDLLRFSPGDVESFEFKYSDCDQQGGLPVFTVSGDVIE